jgi:limonene-1,2-epoxide hydrolase
LTGSSAAVEEVVGRFLAAVAGRDLDAVAATLAPTVQWSNVPHPPAVGRRAVTEMLGAVIDRSEAVRWDVVSAAYDGDRAHLERLDRFWIGGREFVAPCHGVFRVDLDLRQIVEVRDYVDLALWRADLARAGRSKMDDD